MVELGLGLHDLGLRSLCTRALRGHLLRSGLGVLQACLRCRFAIVGGLHAVGRSLLVGKRIGNGRLGGIGRGYGRVPLLLADDVFLDQRLVALEVGLRLGVVGLSLGDARLVRLRAAVRPA